MGVKLQLLSPSWFCGKFCTSQQAIKCLELTIGTLEQGGK